MIYRWLKNSIGSQNFEIRAAYILYRENTQLFKILTEMRLPLFSSGYPWLLTISNYFLGSTDAFACE
jgi:hypothetical protein